MDFSWAQPYPEVYKVCTLFQMAELANPIQYRYKALPQFLQDGPQCGIIALAMFIGNPTKQSVQELYQSAMELNFTFNGEMFSVQNMALLAKKHLPCGTEVKVHSGSLNTEYIRDFILNEGLLLVPYDTEKDNSPGLCNGHKAHWAAVSGGVLTDEDFYILARHGKAKNVAVWKLKTLAESNSQLLEFSPDREHKNIDYKLPEGGISGPLGLNNKTVLIKFSY